jgi:hypothetical protein
MEPAGAIDEPEVTPRRKEICAASYTISRDASASKGADLSNETIQLRLVLDLQRLG